MVQRAESELKLKCECGRVEGTAGDVSAETGYHLVCYCDDCQAFAHHLGTSDRVLSDHGGSEIFQLAPSQITISKGKDQLACLRLTPKGMHRWYADCCNTPIANTLGPKVPFAGLLVIFIDSNDLEERLGPVRVHAQSKYAADSWPNDQKRIGVPLSSVVSIVPKIAAWKLTGKGSPSPFFNRDGEPYAAPQIVGR